ncbi:MAG TPA: SOS response-associated peptidase [Stellaceae bacterium]|nr:SOS response-associated peptidase [Stellaceae bacterium]
MCGRFVLKAPFSELVRLYNVTNNLNLEPRYNIPPTEDVPVVRSRDGKRTLDMLRWGLVPWWAKDIKVSFSNINAKAETVAEKPAFRDAFKEHRCIIPADGFYEWKKLDAKAKQPYAIVMKDRSVFGFAGLWERWKNRASGETVQSCAIVTTTPNEVSAPIHDRMPAILAPENYARWLGEEPTEPCQLFAMLKPYPAEAMEAYPVSTRVGNVKNTEAALFEPLEATS